MLSHFKINYKAAATRTVLYWCKGRELEEQSRRESTEIDPRTDISVIKMQTQFGGKGLVFSRNGARTIDILI